VTIDGANSALTLAGAGAATIGAAAGSAGLLNVFNGGVFNSGSGTTTVNATGSVAITGGTFNSNGNLTLNGGGLTRDVNSNLNLAVGRTFTVQNGGDVSITGDHSFANALTFNVTGRRLDICHGRLHQRFGVLRRTDRQRHRGWQRERRRGTYTHRLESCDPHRGWQRLHAHCRW
jgi:hypothetical protein